jgi:hypothetical protein
MQTLLRKGVVALVGACVLAGTVLADTGQSTEIVSVSVPTQVKAKTTFTVSGKLINAWTGASLGGKTVYIGTGTQSSFSVTPVSTGSYGTFSLTRRFDVTGRHRVILWFKGDGTYLPYIKTVFVNVIP